MAINTDVASFIKNNQAKWVNPLLYLAFALLIATGISYGVFSYKVYLLQQKMAQLNEKLLVYGTPQEKLTESKFIIYKKKIQDFNSIIGSHRTSLTVFDFLENKTLPGIWYSSVSILEVKDEISLTGQASTMEELSRQIKLFEESSDYVKAVTILSAVQGDLGKTGFSLTISLTPKMFTYTPVTTTDSTITEPETTEPATTQ